MFQSHSSSDTQTHSYMGFCAYSHSASEKEGKKIKVSNPLLHHNITWLESSGLLQT